MNVRTASLDRQRQTQRAAGPCALRVRPSCAILCAPTRQWFSRAFVLAKWYSRKVGGSRALNGAIRLQGAAWGASARGGANTPPHAPHRAAEPPVAPPATTLVPPHCGQDRRRLPRAAHERRWGSRQALHPLSTTRGLFPPWHFGCGAGARRATDPLAHPRPRHHVASTPRHRTDVGGMPGGMHARRCRRQSAALNTQPVRCAARGRFFERQTRVSLLTAFPLPVGQLSDTATTEAHRPAERRLPRRRCRRSSRRRRRRPPRRRC